MSIIKTKHLSYHYIRHDEEGNVEGEVPAVRGCKSFGGAGRIYCDPGT